MPSDERPPFLKSGPRREGRTNPLEQSLRNEKEDNLVFPKDLDQIDHWVSFRVHEPEFRKETDYEIKNVLDTIFLPLPANLGTTYSQTYNAEGIGLAGDIGAKLGSDIASNGLNAGISSLADKVVNLSQKDITDGLAYYGLQAAEEGLGAAVGSALGGGVPGALAGAAAGQALKGALAGAGVARNPYMAVMYDSPQFRTHQFSWKLIPKDFDESEIVRKIIYAFKFYGAPNRNANQHFLDYPQQFDIDFHYNDYLHNIGPSVLTSLEVNYHGEGAPLYHDVSKHVIVGRGKNKAPVSVTLSANFQEVFIITKEQINESNR